MSATLVLCYQMHLAGFHAGGVYPELCRFFVYNQMVIGLRPLRRFDLSCFDDLVFWISS